MKLTNIFGKQVFALYEGEVIGTICGAIFNLNNTKIKSFKVFDENDDEFELLLSNIHSMGDYVVVTNKQKLAPYYSSNTNSPMFKVVIDNNANDLGSIVDASILNLGQVEHFLTNKNQNLKPQNMYFRKDFIYYSPKKICIASYKPRTQKPQDLQNIKVKIFNIQNQASSFVPSKISYNPNSIIGKICKGDLLGTNNEIIIRANQTITQKIINDASRHNRLNQLYYLAI